MGYTSNGFNLSKTQSPSQSNTVIAIDGFKDAQVYDLKTQKSLIAEVYSKPMPN